MKRYIIRSKMKATENNKNFAGQELLYFVGKNDFIIAKTGKDADEHGIYGREYASKYFIEEYGYKRRCDAKRNWSYNNPQNDEHWTTETEIVEFTIK